MKFLGNSEKLFVGNSENFYKILKHFRNFGKCSVNSKNYLVNSVN